MATDLADGDADIHLQRIAGDVLGDFDANLEALLFRGVKKGEKGVVGGDGRRVAHDSGDGGRRGGRGGDRAVARALVRTHEACRIANLLEPFQELPQMLDPYLARWLPLLAEAFLQSVEGRAGVAPSSAALPPPSSAGTAANWRVMRLQQAVAQLLYVLCKVRGERVVVGVLPVEARHLEPLLNALERQGRGSGSGGSGGSGSGSGSGGTNSGAVGSGQNNQNGSWTWQERYVVLLWLAQLLLAPFDLASISAAAEEVEEEEANEEDASDDDKDGFVWPDHPLPSITRRVLPIALRYLAVPGKERDAARALLVRLATRRDMQQLGVRQALVRWALGALRRTTPDEPGRPRQPYYYIGTLSFLAGLLSAAAGTSDMDGALSAVFAAVHGIAEGDGGDEGDEGNEDSNPGHKAVVAIIRSSALARKMMIKALRAIAVRYIQLSATAGDASEVAEVAGETIEATIGYLLGRLADNDTPVRFAASKALSVITLRLDPDMAAQVIDAVLDGLQRNVLYAPATHPSDPPMPSLSAVDPLEWHGLMLTLAHLLYRRAPPLPDLPAIVRALRQGLAFERRSVSGTATGTNVRDAACFGVWALARRYTTQELLSLPRESGEDSGGLLQTLATHLVVAAALDPAGNIRRGSAAALQELIGRHPDTVRAGIPLVQAVDYHAVALRARAVSDVAQHAAVLAPSVYGAALRAALLGWRGVADAGSSSSSSSGGSGGGGVDVGAAARRVAAASFGQLTQLMARTESGSESAPGGPGRTALRYLVATVTMLVDRVAALQARQVEERHGFLLALDSVLDAFPALAASSSSPALSAELTGLCLPILAQVQRVLQDCRALKTPRRPELLAEAASRLVVSAFPIVQAALLSSQPADNNNNNNNNNTPSTWSTLQSGPTLLAAAGSVPARAFRETVQALDAAAAALPPSAPALAAIRPLVEVVTACLSESWFSQPQPEVVAATSDTALVLLVYLTPSLSSPTTSPPSTSRHSLLSAWASAVRQRPGTTAGYASVPLWKKRTSALGGSGGGGATTVGTTGHVFALTKAYPLLALSEGKDGTPPSASDTNLVVQAILDRWASDRAIDTRVALLQALAQSPAVMAYAATPTTAATAAKTNAFRAILAAGLDDYTTNARGDVGSHVRLQALRATQALLAQEAVAGTAAAAERGGLLFLRVLRLAAEKLDRVRVAAQAALVQAVGGGAGAGDTGRRLQAQTFSSQAYFGSLLGLRDAMAAVALTYNDEAHLPIAAAVAAAATAASTAPWMAALLRGYVTSADTGNEELVVASRAALVDYVSRGGDETERDDRRRGLWHALVGNLPGSKPARPGAKAVTPPDRIVVPTLEVLAFLFYAGVFSSSFSSPTTPSPPDLAALCRQAGLAAAKAGSVRKLEACVKVYGAVAAAAPAGSDAAAAARHQLAAWLAHPWPRVRDAVVDELWGLGLEVGASADASTDYAVLKGVDWATADAQATEGVALRLGLVR